MKYLYYQRFFRRMHIHHLSINLWYQWQISVRQTNCWYVSAVQCMTLSSVFQTIYCLWHLGCHLKYPLSSSNHNFISHSTALPWPVSTHLTWHFRFDLWFQSKVGVETRGTAVATPGLNVHILYKKWSSAPLSTDVRKVSGCTRHSCYSHELLVYWTYPIYHHHDRSQWITDILTFPLTYPIDHHQDRVHKVGYCYASKDKVSCSS